MPDHVMAAIVVNGAPTAEQRAAIARMYRLLGFCAVETIGPASDFVTTPDGVRPRWMVENPITPMTVEEEMSDLSDRLANLRAASRPDDPLEEKTGFTRVDANGIARPEIMPSAQGLIISAITKLERRRALLVVGKR